MRTNISPVVLSALVLSLVTFSFVLAESSKVDATGTAIKNDKSSTSIRENATSSEIKNDKASTSIRGNATSTEVKNKDASTTIRGNDATSSKEKDDTASATSSSKGELNSELHRSVVSSFVQSLLSVAGREGGIGTQVSDIASTVKDSASTTVPAIKNIESRSAFRTFLFGSDYKSLGIIKSELVTTANSINRLKTLLNRTTLEADRTELNTQINSLEADQAKISTFVTTNENKFSLFGWFNRLFMW